MDAPEDIALADKMNAGRKKIEAELAKLIIGQQDIINQVMLTLFVGGNSLIVGVPGLAKTLLIRTLAQVLDLKFNRIQFTPDLMPSDITGTDLIQEDPATGKRAMVFAPGPIFGTSCSPTKSTAPPKTQAALLEAMQEHRVTIQGRTCVLDEPFYVFATQNPIELEGVSAARSPARPLHVPHRHRASAKTGIRRRPHDDRDPGSKFGVVTGQDLIAFQRLVRRVPVAEPVMRYARTSCARADRRRQRARASSSWRSAPASVRRNADPRCEGEGAHRGAVPT